MIVHDEDHGRLEGNGTLVRQERQINLRLKDGELRRLLLPFDFDEVGGSRGGSNAPHLLGRTLKALGVWGRAAFHKPAKGQAAFDV